MDPYNGRKTKFPTKTNYSWIISNKISIPILSQPSTTTVSFYLKFNNLQSPKSRNYNNFISFHSQLLLWLFLPTNAVNNFLQIKASMFHLLQYFKRFHRSMKKIFNLRIKMRIFVVSVGFIAMIHSCFALRSWLFSRSALSPCKNVRGPMPKSVKIEDCDPKVEERCMFYRDYDVKIYVEFTAREYFVGVKCKFTSFLSLKCLTSPGYFLKWTSLHLESTKKRRFHRIATKAATGLKIQKLARYLKEKLLRGDWWSQL